MYSDSTEENRVDKREKSDLSGENGNLAKMDEMIGIIDENLSFDLFVKNKHFGFSIDKNNEIDCREFTQFLNKQIFVGKSGKLTEEILANAIKSDRFENMKGYVVESRIWIQELKGLGYDWVVCETTVEMEKEILEALKGRGDYIYKIRII